MHDLCQCLRCVNFYRSFIAQAAWLLAPLETFPSTNGTYKKLLLQQDAVETFEKALANVIPLSWRGFIAGGAELQQ
ncbi:hypothetical protein T4E_6596 [Trichinella pseudospiralis]|uniref:Uncharacterized protein n=1 Tax=Trichinella pseudospiralis TaxID=6337 RepID=A0A0V0XRP1_TRIPS|nr:hypothetical protein T4E_6596 [Trichinella pseudospiralis]